MDDSHRSSDEHRSPQELRRTRRIRETVDESTIDSLDETVEDLLALFGKPHTLAIMRLFAIRGGPWRFSEIEDRVDVAPQTLSRRLSALTDAGLLERHAYAEIPPRVEYTWTESARDLSPAIHYVYDWARKNELGDDEAPR